MATCECEGRIHEKEWHHRKVEAGLTRENDTYARDEECDEEPIRSGNVASRVAPEMPPPNGGQYDDSDVEDLIQNA